MEGFWALGFGGGVFFFFFGARRGGGSKVSMAGQGSLYISRKVDIGGDAA